MTCSSMRKSAKKENGKTEQQEKRNQKHAAPVVVPGTVYRAWYVLIRTAIEQHTIYSTYHTQLANTTVDDFFCLKADVSY